MKWVLYTRGWSSGLPGSQGGGGKTVDRRTPVTHLAALKCTPVVAEAGSLSQHYDRARWRVEPPVEPATNADI